MNTTIAGQCENQSPPASGSAESRAGASLPDGASAGLVRPTGDPCLLCKGDGEITHVGTYDFRILRCGRCGGTGHERAVRRASRPNTQASNARARNN